VRIISGKFKGRKFQPKADNWPTRPTTDVAKEGLFNILNNRIDFESVRFLDLFGGTGSHDLEMLSRGCVDVTYVDKFRPAVAFITQLMKELQLDQMATIVCNDVKKFVTSQSGQWDYIFAGPPYPLPWLDEIPDLIFDNQLLTLNGLFVLEHNPDHKFDKNPHFLELRKYGTTYFSFFVNESNEDED